MSRNQNYRKSDKSVRQKGTSTKYEDEGVNPQNALFGVYVRTHLVVEMWMHCLVTLALPFPSPYRTWNKEPCDGFPITALDSPQPIKIISHLGDRKSPADFYDSRFHNQAKCYKSTTKFNSA
ncbi:hypothetical protein CEXT_178431 [Caerostris extrusa]|uniref:Uncharacterized protein n=1 Tax=Caerostris extrusa TaxID=172846 RepID=A0AAV4QP57_CAEEX|nr:hypothetical protein CEXT_178431 [Caerostris extrusa]